MGTAQGNLEVAATKPTRKIAWLGASPFFAIHLLAFGTIWTGITPAAAICFAVLYVVRMFAVTGGYHRYFSHRTYRTSRVFQFILAFLAQTSAQRGALWWAAHHRHHHRYLRHGAGHALGRARTASGTRTCCGSSSATTRRPS